MGGGEDGCCWFLLDFTFCGLGIDSPRRIAAIWAPSYPDKADFQYNIQNWPSDSHIGNSTTVYSNASIPDWENPFDVETNIYHELYGNALRGITYSDTVFCFADTVILLRIDTPFLLDRHSDFTL
jgi:hypothetical protein